MWINCLSQLYLAAHQGGFVNGGEYQLMRPNAFILPQGRCAEYLLYSTLAQVLHETGGDGRYWVPSNGHFDTTEAHIVASGIETVNLYQKGATDTA